MGENSEFLCDKTNLEKLVDINLNLCSRLLSIKYRKYHTRLYNHDTASQFVEINQYDNNALLSILRLQS